MRPQGDVYRFVSAISPQHDVGLVELDLSKLQLKRFDGEGVQSSLDGADVDHVVVAKVFDAEVMRDYFQGGGDADILHGNFRTPGVADGIGDFVDGKGLNGRYEEQTDNGQIKGQKPDHNPKDNLPDIFVTFAAHN